MVPADYDQDGKLDVMLMGQQDPVGRPEDELKMRVYLSNWNSTFSKVYALSRKLIDR